MHVSLLTLFAVTVQCLAVHTQAADDGGSRPAPQYDYRCDGQPNGNYIHPKDCTRYLMCSNDLAYEFDCWDCNEDDNPGRCLNGRAVFDPELGLCNWADVTPCQVGEPEEL